MIGYISGLIIDKEEKTILVLAQSVGYNIKANTDLIAQSKIDTKIQLYIHTVVREDDISLYGFKTKEQLSFFTKLLSVSGIGPKVAMDIVSTPINLTTSAIINGDIGVLTKIKGLGKKTAERMVLELKNKIDSVTINGKPDISNVNEDAIMALESLGYEKFQIIKAMNNLPSEITETEEIVKYFLKTS